MDKHRKKKRRGPYGRHNYDSEINHEDVQRRWIEGQIEEQLTKSATDGCCDQELDIELDEVNLFQTTLNQTSDPELDDILEMIHKSEYDLDDDDYITDTDDVFAELNPPDGTLDDAEEEGDGDFQPLYPGSSVSIGAFMLLLAVFTTKYNLIGDATQQLLNIISFALPNGHKLCTTLHEFKKFFKQLRNPLVFHYYCSYCSGIIEDPDLKKCPYRVCGKTFDKKSANYFLEMPLKNQIQNLFKQENFYDSLLHRFQRNTAVGTYEDIYDGTLYQSHFENGGFLRNPHNLSFTFNTDGAAVFKSSKVSVWPVFLVINELPYKQRMRKENMILQSLWFGTQKPSMGTFLKPFQKSMKELYDGIDCFSTAVGSFTSKGILLCGTADLPARSLLCNHIQYNGAYSCWKCEQEGKTSQVGKGHTRVFPYYSNNPKGPPRTEENVKQTSKLAMNSQKNEKGIKGPSWLLFFPCFNIVSGIAIDYMHGVLLGVEKLLIELWFTQKFSKQPYSFYDKINRVNERLLSIRPTLDITRLPRSILDLQHWKASEYRSFLLFYSAPVLHGILDDERFSHYVMLVNAMHILLKCGSCDKDLEKAERMLFEFCKKFEHYYDECFMRLNIHQLLHLPDCVRSLGPLYTSSCFSFEDKNGVLLKMIRGTQNIDNQIVTGVSFVQKLPELKNKCIEKGSECEKLYNSIEISTVLKRTFTVEKGIYILGGISEKILEDNETDSLQHFLGAAHLQTKFLSFNRIELHDNLIYGLNYTRMMKRNNSVIEYRDAATGINLFAQVRYFICLGDQIKSSQILAIVEPLVCVKYDDHSNILAVNRSNVVKLVYVQDIYASCMLVAFPEEGPMYVCRFPNRMESD